MTNFHKVFNYIATYNLSQCFLIFYIFFLADYTMTDNDFCAQITIETSSATNILVKIDDILVNQKQLTCLLDPKEYLNEISKRKIFFFRRFRNSPQG
jgi:hypothetical protein